MGRDWGVDGARSPPYSAVEVIVGATVLGPVGLILRLRLRDASVGVGGQKGRWGAGG